jgi:hypothetical protein
MSQYDSYIQEEWGGLVGRKIVKVRAMQQEEMDLFGWYESMGSVAIVIHLDDGTLLVPSADPEGNGAGHIFVEGPDDE